MSSRSWSNVSICLPSWTLFSLTINFFRASSSSSSSQPCEPPLAMVRRGLRASLGGGWLLSAPLRRLRCRPNPRPPAAPRRRPWLPRPSLSPAFPAAEQRWELRRGKAKAATPRSKNSKRGVGKRGHRPVGPFRGVENGFFKSSPYREKSHFAPKDAAFNNQNRSAT